ncbi:hypothetical protein L1049_021905 [Liquidambar formosana]|uniref:Uncharacterized protein n=1 Tax=Liquidambar formosana TaxID=63359 RepID=A0AAP0RBM7_LIQFO
MLHKMVHLVYHLLLEIIPLVCHLLDLAVPTETVETLPGALNSLLTPPIIDIQIVVNALHNLSELLIQNRSSDLDSLKENDQEILKHVINNLYLCIRKRGGQRTLVSETAHPGTSYCPRKSTDFHEGTDMGFQVTRTKAVSVQRRPYNQNEHEKQISFPSVYSERVLDSFPPSR